MNKTGFYFVSGHVFDKSFFTTFSTAEYGNCFTIDLSWIKAVGSGPQNGVNFVFNVESHEYFNEITSGYGVRMVIHERGRIVLPETEGLTLSTNQETNIGLQLIKVERLGGKYGSCTDGRSFLDTHNLNYTVQLCYIVCQIEHIESECGCVPVSTPDRYKTDRPVCDTFANKTLDLCVGGTKFDVLNGHVECDCPPRCQDQLYTYTSSGRQWPHENYLRDVLIDEVCNRGYEKPFYQDLCKRYADRELTDADMANMSRNFAAVNVYFEDLNYEMLKEEPMYNPVRFLSDIGGTMGLFTGASMLTYFEILHVLVAIGIFFCSKRRPAVHNMD